MTWGFVAAAAVTVVGGVLSNSSKKKQEKAQQTAANISAYKDYTNSVSKTMENNRAIGEANTVNQIRTGYRVGLLNLQTAKLKEQAAVEGWGVSKTAQEALGNADAGAAASGTVGASVSAVSMDIRKKSDEAQIAVDDTWEDVRIQQLANLNSVLESGSDVLKSTQAIPDIASVNTGTYKGVSNVAAGAGALIGAYASGAIRFG